MALKINAVHPDYSSACEKWSRCRDAISGEDSVKAAGTVYLPMLEGQSEQEYGAYKKRAFFFGATRRTVYGLTGAVFRTKPRIETPEALQDWLEHAGSSGETFQEIAKSVAREVIGLGRGGLFVDSSVEPDAEPFIAYYNAEAIINWRTQEIDGRDQLVLVVLQESHMEPVDDYESKVETRYRVLRLSPAEQGGWAYSVEVWKKLDKSGPDGNVFQQVGDTVYPKFRGGRPVTYIPFTFVNAESTDPEITDPPLLDLVNMNMSHYRTAADLEHGRHFTALPTPWVTGFDPKTTKLTIGAGVAWVAEDPNARCGMLEFTGAGLGSLKDALTQKEVSMAVLGSRLLEEQKAGVEAATTVVLRQSGERCVLAFISRSVSEALTRCLRWSAEWLGVSDTASIEVELNEDFGTQAMDSATLTALMTYVQQGYLSWDSLFTLLQKGGYIAEERTLEEERDLITAGTPIPSPAVTTSPDGSQGGGAPGTTGETTTGGGNPPPREPGR